MSRVSQKTLDEIIEHHGELKTGPVNALGVLRMALDLKEARVALDEEDPQTPRQRKRLALIQEYRDIFSTLASGSPSDAVYREAKDRWVEMFRRMKKRRYLRFYADELEIPAALVALKLAVRRVYSVTPDARNFGYSNELGQEPEPFCSK